MIIIDTNYFFALLHADDSLHLKAVNISSSIKDFPVLYLEDILKEMQTILSVRKSHTDSFNWIDSIYQNEYKRDRQYNLSSVEYFEVVNYWRSLKDTRLSFVDAEILYLSNKYNFKVLTFDKEIISRLPKKLVFN